MTTAAAIRTVVTGEAVVTGDTGTAGPAGVTPPSAVSRRQRSARVVLTDDQFMLALRANPAYQHLDLTAELARMDAWLLAHPSRKKTRRFIVAWLNRVERPVVVVTPKRSRTLREEREDQWLDALPKTLADFVRARAKVEPRDLEGLTPSQRAAYDAIIEYRRTDVPERATDHP